MTLNNNSTLLLTAAVNVGSTPFTARADPLVRLRDYERALSWWLGSGAVRQIVFCENSGHALGPFQTIATAHPAVETEFLSFNSPDSETRAGKGFAELSCIRKAFAESQLLRRSRIVMKCTGRLTLLNALPVIHGLDQEKFDVSCTLKHHLSFADSRFFAATPEFYETHLASMHDHINDLQDFYLEHALACATAQAVALRKRWRPFPVFPHIRGISGTHNKEMFDGVAVRALKTIYHRGRRFVYEH